MGRSRQKQRPSGRKTSLSDQVLKQPKFKAQQKPKTNATQPSKLKRTPVKNLTVAKDDGTGPPIKTTIPFSVYDRILLIGEGDFSFSASLTAHHGVADIWATSYDSKEGCLAKYPNSAKSNIENVLEAFDEQLSDDDDEGSDSGGQSSRKRVIFGVDATSIGKHSIIRQLAPFHRMVFNFPHTGGLSTDVNRQVRANQALLSSFFKSAIPLLSKPPPPSVKPVSSKPPQPSRRRVSSRPPPPPPPSGKPVPSKYQTHHDLDPDDPEAPRAGSIIITLFESEPYSLWNVRDLARNAGLTVWRSWKFEAGAFPGYRHARTVGTIVDKEGNVSENAWKGEERNSRCYEFGIGPWPGEKGQKKKKNRRPGEESSSEDE
jgi:25S rRNA (uracil2634-N3)-methyltransferase